MITRRGTLGLLIAASLLVSCSALAQCRPKVRPATARTSASGPSDAELVIVGYNDMQSMLESVGTLFHEAHPRVTLRLNLPGTATAASALSLGQSALAAMGAEFSDREMASFVALNGVAPIRVRIAHCSMNPSARSAPVGIYVNAANPIAKMTTTQVARIFTTGNPDGDISMWSQMTADPAWKGRAIHPCGIAEEAAAGLSPFMLSRMGRRPYTLIFSAFAQSRDAVRCVAEDPSAIAFASANIRDPKTRLLAIATSTGGPFWVPSTDNIRSGHYPYDRFLYVYLKQSKGKVSDNLAREYLCIVLSSSGQAAIGAAAPGYVPLSESERREERAKLE